MTAERTDGVTPNGGEYTIAVYVNLATLEEVDKQNATGVVITEYDHLGGVVSETVGEFAFQP